MFFFSLYHLISYTCPRDKLGLVFFFFFNGALGKLKGKGDKASSFPAALCSRLPGCWSLHSRGRTGVPEGPPGGLPGGSSP